MSAVGGELERRRDWTERVGEEKNKNRESGGLEFRWLPVGGGTQQPTKIWPK